MSARTIASRLTAIGLSVAGVTLLPATVVSQHRPGPDGVYFSASRPGLNPFDRSKAALHFNLYTDGAAIDLSVVHPTDDVTRHEVQIHMQRVALALAEGDFSAIRSAHAPAAQPTSLHVLMPTGKTATGDASTFFVPGVATADALRAVTEVRLCGDAGGRTRQHHDHVR